jgi:hypothetical protein
MNYPNLLNYEEQIIMRIIEEYQYEPAGAWKIRFKNGADFDFQLIRDCWKEINDLAEDEPDAAQALNIAMKKWAEDLPF